MSGKPMFEGIDLSGLDELRVKEGASSEGSHAPARLPLTAVAEDPDQPRTVFDEDALKELAASIAKRGVLQPIVVRPANADGQHIIAMGARRYRASLLAKAEFIPAFIRIEASDGYDQMIENIQREALSHRDVAAFIRNELAKGKKQTALAASLGKPKAWVTPYVGFFDFDPAIQAGVEKFGIRTAYELQASIKLDPDRTKAFMADNDAITQRGARDFAQSLRDRSSPDEVSPSRTGDPGSADDEGGAGASSLPPAPSSPAATPPAELTGERASSGKTAEVADEPSPTPRFAVMVKAGDRIGRLAIDQPAKQGSNYGTVIIDGGQSVIEVAVADMSIIEIVKLD